VENRTKVLRLLESFAPFTQKYSCTTGQLVIAWTASQPGCTHVLAGARSPAQVGENLPGGDILLDEEDVRAMRELLLGRSADIV
jgi:aryl-alcohol dehydrogenase-like predicted oxidoreductase